MDKAVNKTHWIFLGLALTIAAAIYWPGLTGWFIYDDFSFVLGNDGIKVNAGSLREWFTAAMAFPAGAHQGRWLTMLSFGVNHYLSGMDPYWFKLTNLGIHLLNGLLVFLALRALFDFHHATRTEARHNYNASLVAAALASLWLVLPINLTAVLYISQRLESLSSMFVFLGLWAYLRLRARDGSGPTQTGQLWLILLVCTGVGAMAKESAILLPLYTALAEFALTGFKDVNGRWNRPILILYGSLLLLPLVVGLIWLAGWVDGTRSFGRAYSIPERLMTESRILFEYMQWTFLPSLDALTLYHDDIPVSKGLLEPPTTLLSMLGIATILGAAVFQRQRSPLLALGILWYFGGHVLTGTVIPLMLAFEHRNYFSSIGLLLALASLLALEGWHLRTRTIALAFFALFSFYAFTTAMRAVEWSNPVRLAMSQAAKRPNSPSAQYGYAFKLLNSGLRRSDGQSLGQYALLKLDEARKLDGAGIMFEQLLITSHAKSHLEIKPEWWADLIQKLKLNPANASDVKALHQLNSCFLQHICKDHLNSLKQAYAAALAHGNPRAELLGTHSEFAWHVLGDKQVGERDIRAAVLASPNDFNARNNLLILLLATDQLDEAKGELAKLKELNHFGFYDELIDVMAKNLRSKLEKRSAAEQRSEILRPESAESASDGDSH